MALIDELEKINEVLTFYERCINLQKRSVLTGPMFDEIKSQVIAYLETYFPPTPP